MTNKCKLCKHRDVCKYKEQYEKEYNELNKKTTSITYPFYIELECNYFRDANIYTPIITYQPYPTTLNECKNCPNDERIKKGEMNADEACCWCPNSPTILNTSNKCGDKLTDEVVCQASGTNNTVGIQHCYDTVWTTINNENQQILKHSKPTWCDRPYPCAECDRADYCVDKYNSKENK